MRLDIKPVEHELIIPLPDSIREKLPVWLTNNCQSKGKGSGARAKLKQLIQGDEMRALISPILDRMAGNLVNLFPKPPSSNGHLASEQTSHRVVAWITPNEVIFGAGKGHGNPPENSSAEKAAAAVALSSGLFDCVIGGYILDLCPGRRKWAGEQALSYIDRHLHPKLGDAFFVDISTQGKKAGRWFRKIYNPWLREVSGEVCSEPLRQRSPIRMSVVHQLPNSLNRHNAVATEGEDLIEAIKAVVIKRAIGNSTSLGDRPPASKGHVAVAVFEDIFIHATNSRDPEFSEQVNCAEDMLCSICTTYAAMTGNSRYMSWSLTLVYSPDYVRRDRTGHDHPISCPPCLGKLSRHLLAEKVPGSSADPVPDMLIMSLNDESAAVHHTHRRCLPNSWADREKDLVPGNSR